MPLGTLIYVLVMCQLFELSEFFFFAAFLDEQGEGIGDVAAVRCGWDVCQGQGFEVGKHGGLEAARISFSCFDAVASLCYFLDELFEGRGFVPICEGFVPVLFFS